MAHKKNVSILLGSIFLFVSGQVYPDTEARNFGSKYSPLKTINKDNISRLELAWKYHTKDIPATPGLTAFQDTPVLVGDNLIVCSVSRRVIALDPQTGAERWVFDPKSPPNSTNKCRGVSVWQDDKLESSAECSTRLFMGTSDYRLISLDATTGKLCSNFGEGGIVTMQPSKATIVPGEVSALSRPAVVNDTIVVGSSVMDNQRLNAPSGQVLAFNARTGQQVWAFDPVPRKQSDIAARTWEGGLPVNGGGNVWAGMVVDEALDMVYLPTTSPSVDFYGGERLGDNLYTDSVVALKGSTGEVVWHFQIVHHDVWDYDLPAQPVLVDVERDGETVPAVAVPTKMGDIFLLDRRDGTPVHPIEEHAVPQSDLYGESLSATQPVSPLPNFHPYRHEKDMWGLTPIDQLLCRVEYNIMNYQGMFTPPSADGPLLIGGTMLAPGNFGGFNWGSVSVDADNGLLIAAPQMLAHRLNMATPEQIAAAGPIAGLILGSAHPAVRMNEDDPIPEPREPNPDDPFDYVRIKYYGFPQPFMSKLGTRVPCFEPPWSKIAVMDLNTKELLWSRPLGTMKNAGPFGWQSGLPIEVGVAVRAGTLTTRGGLTFISSTMDSTVRAYDVRTGEIKWSQALPGNSQSTPMSYLSKKNGKQYL